MGKDRCLIGLSPFNFQISSKTQKSKGFDLFDFQFAEELMNNEAIIGDKSSHTQLISGNDTNLIGNQVFGSLQRAHLECI